MYDYFDMKRVLSQRELKDLNHQKHHRCCGIAAVYSYTSEPSLCVAMDGMNEPCGSEITYLSPLRRQRRIDYNELVSSDDELSDDQFNGVIKPCCVKVVRLSAIELLVDNRSGSNIDPYQSCSHQLIKCKLIEDDPHPQCQTCMLGNLIPPCDGRNIMCTLCGDNSSCNSAFWFHYRLCLKRTLLNDGSYHTRRYMANVVASGFSRDVTQQLTVFEPPDLTVSDDSGVEG